MEYEVGSIWRWDDGKESNFFEVIEKPTNTGHTFLADIIYLKKLKKPRWNSSIPKSALDLWVKRGVMVKVWEPEI